jgi:general secretion pathway protein L
MSTLILQLPEHRRLRAGAESDAAADPRRREYAYVTSTDGIELEAQGAAAAALLPTRSVVIAVVQESDVSWHRITLPKAPASRLRSALVGVTEEALLDDAEQVHLAVAPLALAGQPTWIAAVDKAWLRDELDALQKKGVFVDRVVPMAWPDDPPTGHFHAPLAAGVDSTTGVVLTWASVDGVATVRLDGGLARALLPTPIPPTTRWSAAPMAAQAAERWLGAPVNVMPIEQRLLQAGRSLWNLRQFELARRTRGARAFGDWLRQAMSPAWRPVRIGIAVLLAAQIIGLNVWAWHQKGAVEARRGAIQALVKKTFPRVGAGDVQRDAAAVMARETQSLRTLAGKAGDADLEPMLQAAAAAWPGERPPVENLRFEPGKLTLTAGGWSDAQIEQFRAALQPAGFRVEASEGRLVLTRRAAA